MPVTINGDGSITGLSVGGLPNGTVDADTLASNAVTSTKLHNDAITGGHMPTGTVIQTKQGSPEALETDAAETIIQTQPFVRRGVSLLAVVASVAPLLGLLGTVTGMIGTFGMITEHGTGDPRLLSGGISQALLTTQFGLMVAIPALLFQTTLYRWGDAILRRVERFALKTLDIRLTKNSDADGSSKNVVAVRSA
mgnify:CR=1 FL=1